MCLSRRRKYYIECQEIIDNLHNRIAKGDFIHESECKDLYGKAQYDALLHELRMMNAGTDWTTMTPAMEWLYHSQYFKYKAYEESVAMWQRIVVYISVAAAVFSAIFSYKLVNKETCITIYKEAGSYYDKKPEEHLGEEKEVTPKDEVINGGNQRSDARDKYKGSLNDPKNIETN